MSKTLELPDDLAALIGGPEAEAQAIKAIREHFATTNRHRSEGRMTPDEYFAELAAALGVEPPPPFEKAMQRAREEADRQEARAERAA